METDQSVATKLTAIRDRILQQQKLKNTNKSRNGYQNNNHRNNNRASSHNGHQRKRKKEDRAFTRTLTVHIIETEEATDAAVEVLQRADFVGFDCEGILTMGRTGKVSLIQVCDRDTVYLFDVYGMNEQVPASLAQWLSSDRCVKFVHDSRQDQDALYHSNGYPLIGASSSYTIRAKIKTHCIIAMAVVLGGIFDTTIANLVYRVWFAKARASRLTGMDALSHSLIHNVQDYKVNLRINRDQTAGSVSVSDLRQEFRERMKEKKQRARAKRKRTGDDDAKCDEEESEDTEQDDTETEEKEETQQKNGSTNEDDKEDAKVEEDSEEQQEVKEESTEEDAKEEEDSEEPQEVKEESTAAGWKTYKVNIFDLKQNTKLMMNADCYLWAKRPIPVNLVIYAAVDGYVSLLMGQYYRRKFKQWMIEKTLFVSARWCRMVAREVRIKASSAKVAPSIVKLIRSNTEHLDVTSLPPIDEKFKYKKEREEAEQRERQNGATETETDTVEMDFDDLLLLTSSGDFIARQMEKKLNPNQKHEDKQLYTYMSDVYKLTQDLDGKDQSARRLGKLNYHRLIPLKLLEQEIDSFI
eukprot:CAMPEP_0197080256 /NCGR_PEP_ID=MMETSP1384-20130603/214036_1 /TAXON_ID=29189 /ORGANISM="Ammonia sp." /LENGTH=581 /DNA_ID=CAMNT_0042519139 /DNA_START=918 /DNA_END=2663 /DNA_ORIENTATION=+